MVTPRLANDQRNDRLSVLCNHGPAVECADIRFRPFGSLGDLTVWKTDYMAVVTVIRPLPIPAKIRYQTDHETGGFFGVLVFHSAKCR